jgi:hypothetical protein
MRSDPAANATSTGTGRAPAAFPAAWRWAAAAWLVVWFPAYAVTWGWKNFLALCDVAVILTGVGIWIGSWSSLLLSSQVLPAVLVGGLWAADVAGRLMTGKHLIGGTEYMWDDRFPLAVRLLSLFHLVLPVVLVAGLRRVGYDRRGLALQTAITAVLLVAARLVSDPVKNLNYAFRDPIWGRFWGSIPTHLGFILVGALVLVYLPTHLALSRALRPPAEVKR